MTDKSNLFDDTLMKAYSGYRACHMIRAATRLGIADLLADGPKSAAALAQPGGWHLPSLVQLLRALSAFGLLSEEPGGYTLTPFGERLWREPSTAQWVLFFEEDMLRAWQGLAESVRDGRSAFEHVHGSPFYEHYARHPEGASTFDAWMDRTAQKWLASFARSHDFSGIGTILDVGGGRGRLIADILRANPAMRGVLVDLPHVVAGAPALLTEAGVADRCEVVAGDAFASLPEGSDAYLLSRVLFNWNDERAALLLSSCRRSMKPESKLIVIDSMLPSGGGSARSAFSALFFTVQFGSKLRSEDDFRRLFAAAGFELTRTVEMQDGSDPESAVFRFFVIEGTPV
jgi:hypothetical protein